MSHHDGRVKGGKIKCGDRIVIVSLLRFDHRGTFVLFLIARSVHLHGRHHISLLGGLAEQLRDHLYLLAPSEEIVKGNAGDTCHFNIIDQTHLTIHQSLGKIGILEAIYCQASTGLFVAVEEIGNDGMLHVLLLFAQKVSTNGI